jgi:hypothetical protein
MKMRLYAIPVLDSKASKACEGTAIRRADIMAPDNCCTLDEAEDFSTSVTLDFPAEPNSSHISKHSLEPTFQMSYTGIGEKRNFQFTTARGHSNKEIDVHIQR